ncbi:MAG TPA: hypothetical protein VF245_09525 [Solirubrobacterales bacterium]
MKIASLWSEQEGGLALKPELKRCEEATLKARLLEFLRGGGVVLQASGLREDRLDPAAPVAVPLGYLSDGEWIWPQELAYYLEVHDVLPEAALLEHARERDFRAAQPPPGRLAEAANLLTRGE